MSSGYQIFNRSLLRKRRARIVRNNDDSEFLFHTSAARMVEVFDDIKQKQFSNILEIGARKGVLQELLGDSLIYNNYIAIDCCYELMSNLCNEYKLVADEEVLPFREGSFDLILSNLNMHWINDLPGFLVQVNRSLRKGGLFMCSFVGETSLHELKHTLLALVKEGSLDMRPRVSPFVTVKDAGLLLQRAGFSLPVSNVEQITLSYDKPEKLFKDISLMGEGNCLLKRESQITTKYQMDKIVRKYNELFANNDGIPATVDIISVIGWK